MPKRERVLAFIDRVVARDYVGAIEDFYTEDASMQENLGPPRVGRGTLMDHEKSVLSRLTEMRTFPAPQFAIEGDMVFIRWTFEMVRKDGSTKRFDEVAMQEWQGDRIVRERFYYDPAQLQA